MNAQLVYSSKDYAHLPKTVLSSDDEPKCYYTGREESVNDMIAKKYISLLFFQRKKLDNISLFLYNKVSDVPENQTRKAFLQIIELENRAKKSMQMISNEIKNCLGREMFFYNKANPIAISNIMNAYKAICNNSPKSNIWHQLLN